MKKIFFRSVACLIAMAPGVLAAQSTTTASTPNQSNSLSINKVQYQAEDELTDKSFSGNYYLNIVATGSTPVESTSEYSYAGSGCFYLDNLDDVFDVNLHLPDGHSIEGLRYFFEDGNAGNSTVYLYKMFGDGSFTELLQFDSTGSSGTYTSEYEELIPQHIVNNANGSYVLRFYASETGSTQQMCSARLFMNATP